MLTPRERRLPQEWPRLLGIKFSDDKCLDPEERNLGDGEVLPRVYCWNLEVWGGVTRWEGILAFCV